MDAITYWNDAAQEANRVAHTSPQQSDAGPRGPAGSSRAFAIVHLAMHDAYFTIKPATANPPHGTYLAAPPAPAAGASAEAAIAAAAHSMLSKLYPAQKSYFMQHHLGTPLAGGGTWQPDMRMGLRSHRQFLRSVRTIPAPGTMAMQLR